MVAAAPSVVLPLAALIAVASAVPAAEYGCKPRTICVDAVNKCGIKYGGCYNVCDKDAKPKPPPCSPSITTVTTVTVPTTTPGDDCSSRTVCADYINECGQMYGGCFPDCKPWPTFTPPPCTSPTSKPVTTTTSPVTSDDCSTRTVCADYVNECGQWYGGCFPDCKPWPTFTPPPCTPTSSKPPATPTSPSPSDNCSTRTVCADYVNECGQKYGGCFADCKPWPSFTPPPCPPTTTTPPVVTPPPETTSCTATGTVCVDSINACGQTYGGCFPDCKPWPTFTPPPCPKGYA